MYVGLKILPAESYSCPLPVHWLLHPAMLALACVVQLASLQLERKGLKPLLESAPMPTASSQVNPEKASPSPALQSPFHARCIPSDVPASHVSLPLYR